MQIIGLEKKQCACCMEEHEVKTVLFTEHTTFKGKELEFEAEGCYCDSADSIFETEEQFNANDRRLKEAYKKTCGLLSSGEIIEIRKKYGISQTDFCILLGWGEKTIARYESGYQVQDRAHDIILRKLSEDPEWFIHLLTNAEQLISKKAFEKYLQQAKMLYKNQLVYYEQKVNQAKNISVASA